MSNTPSEPSGSATMSSESQRDSGGLSPDVDVSEATSESAGTTAPRKRRRGSRGGRGRNAAARAARAAARAEASTDAPSTDEPAKADEGKDGGTRESVPADSKAEIRRPQRNPRRRRTTVASKSSRDETTEGNEKPRGFEGVAVRKPRIGDVRKPVVDDAAEDSGQPSTEAQSYEDDSTDDRPKRKRRRGGRRRSAAKRAAEAALVEDSDTDELDETSLEKRRGRERKGRPVGRYLMCVQRREGATQIAVLEGRSLIEHYVSRPHDDISQIDGNVYLSRVQNVLPGMEAAFIDIGTPKNAVLYRGDVRYDADELAEGARKSEQPRIEDMIKAGQIITCQVTKNPIGLKGARLTQEVSLPGRFVVLLPNNSTYGISKRLPDDERKRLRRVLDDVKPKEHGLIVRTAAEGATADELRRDVQRLLKQWGDIEHEAKNAKAPKLLYREPDMAVRIIREEFNRHYRGVIIDDPALYEEVHEYVSSISPELADRIEFFDTNAEPLSLFERYHVHEQVQKALDRKVWLPSGGSLIIERTEALTVIDVNTGKNVGKSNLEETVFRNNLEAAEEIARQLRLRDIGGIIVIDFIDMEVRQNREAVLTRLRDALSRDKTRTQAFPISDLGLVEMTRKRVSEGLVESFSHSCDTCSGRGFVIDQDLLNASE